MASESSSIPGIMVFRPTIEEFSDFSAYIKKMEDCGAHKFGIAKVKSHFLITTRIVVVALIFTSHCGIVKVIPYPLHAVDDKMPRRSNPRFQIDVRRKYEPFYQIFATIPSELIGEKFFAKAWVNLSPTVKLKV